MRGAFPVFLGTERFPFAKFFSFFGTPGQLRERHTWGLPSCSSSSRPSNGRNYMKPDVFFNGGPSLKARSRHLSPLPPPPPLPLPLSSFFFFPPSSAPPPSSFPKFPSIATRSNIMHTPELIPSKEKSFQTRSWRRTVADALALAQRAVELDSRNTDPMSALNEYTKSVRHLRSICARLERHGARLEASRLAAIVCRRVPFLHLSCPVIERLFWLMAVRVLLRTDALVVRGVCGTAAAIRLFQFRVQRLLVTSTTYITGPTRVRRTQPCANTGEEILAELKS